MGETYSAILAFVEGGGKAKVGQKVKLRSEIWDYVKALQTNQTWDNYTPNGFTPKFVQTMTPRVLAKTSFLSGLGACVGAIKNMVEVR